ncbi:MAG: YbaB/EbfC family nucleoid-associated protein [Parcubacteria group bacterium]|nr:YbaB/EbfC family nucleoid-associated protein [Parcubacteria group bacterium]
MALFSKLKQIQELRSQAKKLQDALGSEVISVTSRDGRIKLTIDGNQHIKELVIDPAMQAKPELAENLRDTLNNALREVQKKIAQKMRDLQARGEWKMPDLTQLG